MKLISMTDFVISKWSIDLTIENRRLIYNYANFLKRLLTIDMFVPCDENGNVLEVPDRWEDYLNAPESFDGNKEWYDFYNYEQAKERVLFEGFEIEDIGLGSFAIRKNGWIIMRRSKSIGAKWENINSYLDIESLLGFDIELTKHSEELINTPLNL